MIRKVGYIFVTLDGKVKGDVQGVDTVCCTIFMMIDLAANVAGTSLESLQERFTGRTSASDLPVCSRCTSIQNQMVYLS